MNILNRIFGNQNNEQSVLAEVELNNETPQLFALNIRGNENPMHYLLEDPNKLAKIKKKWKFKPKDNMGRCGYDYNLFVESGNIKKSILICFECNTLIVNNSKIYEISKEQILERLVADFLPLKMDVKKFSTREEGKKYWETENQNPNVVSFSSEIPKWIEYECSFWATHRINDSEFLGAEDFQDQITIAKNLFSEFLKHKNTTEENFDVQYMAIGSTDGANYKDFTFTVFSSKNFFERVELKSKINYREFENFELRFLYR